MAWIRKDKVAHTAQNRKISFAECLLFYYLARQALSFGRRREREKRKMLSTKLMWFFFSSFILSSVRIK